MTREELLKTREYWITRIQINLYELIESYRKENGLNKSQLAEKLGVTKGYITQILNGDFDHKISKLVDLSLAFGKAPVLEYKDINQYIQNDGLKYKAKGKRLTIKNIINKTVDYNMYAVIGRPAKPHGTNLYISRKLSGKALESKNVDTEFSYN